MNGLNSGDFVKVFDASFNEIWRCSQYGNASPCNSTEVVTGLGNGTFFVQACDEIDSYTLSGCSGGGGGTPTNNCTSTTNVAQGKSTQQSSTLTVSGITGSSSKAVDGNTNGTFFVSPAQNFSVSATQTQSRPYWQVDLQSNHFIEEIKIYNRTDGADKTRDAYVLVSDQPFTSNSLSTSRSQADYEFFISGSVGSPSVVTPELVGRYVRVQMEGSGYLVMGEVQVMGCLSNSLNSNANTLIAFQNSNLEEEEIDLKSIVVFPNPTQNEVNIDLGKFLGQKALIRIFDTKGVLVKEHQVDAATTYPEQIDLKDLVNGLYLIAVKLEDHKLITKPFSIKKLY